MPFSPAVFGPANAALLDALAAVKGEADGVPLPPGEEGTPFGAYALLRISRKGGLIAAEIAKRHADDPALAPVISEGDAALSRIEGELPLAPSDADAEFPWQFFSPKLADELNHAIAPSIASRPPIERPTFFNADCLLMLAYHARPALGVCGARIAALRMRLRRMLGVLESMVARGVLASF